MTRYQLYTNLASWFHLLTAPADYAEEADFARQTIITASSSSVRNVLELGSGGGNNAFHLKRSFVMTLTDVSPSMLEVSRRINPECEHIAGDMRTLRLEREFDSVFVHDAVAYLTTREDLLQCLKTAFVHCKRKGVALFLPDFVRESFAECVHHGGHDGEGRALRHYEWTFDPDPSDHTYTVDFVYLLREGRADVRVQHETHECGLFEVKEWLELLEEAGFQARPIDDPYRRVVFLAVKP